MWGHFPGVSIWVVCEEPTLFQHCYIHTVAVQKVPILIQEALFFLAKEEDDHAEILFGTHPIKYREMTMDFMDTYFQYVEIACCSAKCASSESFLTVFLPPLTFKSMEVTMALLRVDK